MYYCVRSSKRRRPRCGTMVDAYRIDEIVELVRWSANGTDTDGVLDRLARTFATFSPNEGVLRRLSLMHQRCAGTSGEQDFAVTTVYGVATDAVGRGDAPRYLSRPPYVSIRRARSLADRVGSPSQKTMSRCASCAAVVQRVDVPVYGS